MHSPLLRAAAVLMLLALLAACGAEAGSNALPASGEEDVPGGGDGLGGKADDPNGADPVDDGEDEDGEDAEELPLYWTCTEATPPTGLPTVDWEHFSTKVVTLGSPGHSAQDVMDHDEAAPLVVGKFAYGAVSKDLEDERIEVWVDDCSGSYVRVGEGVTDSDGRVAVAVPLELLPGIGRFGVYLRVMGDNSGVSSTLRVLPKATRAMVFDIDGTLTTADMELFQDLLTDLFEPILGGDYVPEARAAAVDLAWLRYEQGYELVFLTGRPYLLTDATRTWLDDLGFPPGNVHVTDSNTQILPTEGSVGAYKVGYLERLQASGFIIDGAYGNAATDIFAYDTAGVPHERTWIAGPKGGEGGTQAVGDDYVTHLPEALEEEPAVQPFER